MYHIPDDEEDSFSLPPTRILARPKSRETQQSETVPSANAKISPNVVATTTGAGPSFVTVCNVGSTSIGPTDPPGASSKEQQKPPVATSARTPYTILVNSKQKGNPVLKFIRNVPWEYADIVPDYEMGRCTCALYISLKYHNRYPEYIHKRLKDLGKAYDLRVLLAQVDTKQQDVSHELNQLAKICILADCTLIVAFSFEEAGRYLEVYKAYENKPPTEIMGKTNTDFLSQATECLTSVKGVNKTDSTTLLTNFKTMKRIIQADVDQLGLCPGVGPLKARRLDKVFSDKFRMDGRVKSSLKSTIVEAKSEEQTLEDVVK